MLLSRVSPFALLDEMQRSFSLIDEMNQGARPTFSRAHYPALNAWSDETNFYVEAELPGMALGDLEIYVTNGRLLTIQGKRGECNCGEQGTWIRRERGYGAFQRQLELPGPVDEEQVEASFKQGVLTIKLSKAKEIRPRRIEVKTA